MSDNDKVTVPKSDISTKEFLTKVEEAARNGAIKGSKGRRGIRLFELLKTSVNPVRLKNHPIALDENTIDTIYHMILNGET